MKFLEYIYLAFAVGLGAILVSKYGEFSTTERIIFVVGIAMAAFMYSFRKTQRKRSENRNEGS